MTIDRRGMLKTAALGAPALLAGPVQAGMIAPPPVLRPNSIPVADLPGHYDIDRRVHNLEAGYWSMMPRVVAETRSTAEGSVQSL